MNTQKVVIPVTPEIKLQGMILSDPAFTGKRPVILVIHGWTSQMARYPERLRPEVEIGYVVLLFDLRGHGETGGELSKLCLHDHLNDCLAAYDYLMGLEQTDRENVSIFGSSYGGYLASLVAAYRKVNHLVLCVPASYPSEIFDQPGVQRGELTALHRKKVLGPAGDKALKAISEFTGDLLLIEAEHDEQVNPQVMKNYRSVAKDGYAYELIKGADHSMRVPGSNEARVKVMAEWFEKFI